MAELRTPESTRKYRESIEQGALRSGCPLCRKTPLQSFTFWRIVQNDFPYDRIAKTHHMLVPNRHIAETALTQEEQLEYAKIKKDYLHDNYDYFLEASAPQRSIPEHFHLHLIVVKE